MSDQRGVRAGDEGRESTYAVKMDGITKQFPGVVAGPNTPLVAHL